MSYSVIRRVVALAAPLVVTVALAYGSPAMADGIPDDPLARFEGQLCPGIIGLEREAAQGMVARIRHNADRLGLSLADEAACDPNLVIAFLADGQDYLQRLSDERGFMFASLSHQEQEDLLAREGPARTWLTTETRTRDGLWVGRRENLVDVPRAAMWSAHSLIYVPTRQEIVAAMVLIDRDAVAGLSVAQLADYATLHGLAEYLPEPAAATPSIQRLFTPGATPAPAGLSEFDLAYLERLYSSIPNLPAHVRLDGLEGAANMRD